MKLAPLLLLIACTDASLTLQAPRVWTESADGARCAVLPIEPVAVRALRIDFAGDDRVALYRADRAGAPCAALGMGDPLLVATPRQRELALPDGVAFELGDELVLEAGPNVELGSISVALTTGAYDAPATIHHLALPPVAVGPNAAAVVDDTLAMPAELAGREVFAFVGHTHRRGAGVRIAIATGLFGDRIPVYLPTTFIWSAPPTQVLDPRRLPDDARLYVQCAYYNTSTAPIDDELCAFWAYAR